jgi:hypothetical protein
VLRRVRRHHDPFDASRPDRNTRPLFVMSINLLASALRDIERQAVIQLIRAHPEWTLGAVIEMLQSNPRHEWLTRELTIAELRDDAPRPTGGEVDDEVIAALAVSSELAVPISLVCARTRLPRHTVWRSLGRLASAGRVERTGVTSMTRYKLVAA